MKKPILVLLWLLLSLFLSSCQSRLTYDEMNAAYLVTVDPEEKTELEERLERFETDVDRADTYFRLRTTCSTNNDLIWYCYRSQYTERRTDQILASDLSIDSYVKLYRRMRNACECASRDAVMRALQGF